MISSHNKWTAVLYLAAIFLAGAVSGWVVGDRVVKKPAAPAPQPPPFGPPWTRSSVYEVGLSAEQTNQAKGIIEKYARQMEAIEKEHRAFIRTASSNRNEELKGILSKDQCDKWDRQRKEREAAWQRARTNWSGTNGFRGWPPPNSRDRGDRGERKGGRERQRDSDTNTADRPDVTNPSPAQSTPTPAPPEGAKPANVP